MPDPRLGSSLSAPRERVVAGVGAWRLTLFFIFVFSVFLASYLGLQFGYANYLRSEIEDVDQELAALAADEALKKQDEFLTFQYQLVNLQSLLAKHVPASRLMPFFENATNQRVQYTGFNFHSVDWTVDLTGIAGSYVNVAEQLQTFQTMKEVQSYRITSVKLREGGKVDFTAAITFTPSAFSYQ